MSATLTPPRGCGIGTRSDAEVAAHAALADELRGLVIALTSAPGRVTIALSIPADDDRIACFVATERECCAFLSPEVGADVHGATITWSSPRPSDRDGLRSIAAMFDPANADLPAGDRVGHSRAIASIGLVGLACGLACALPVLFTAGGVAAIGGQLSGIGWLGTLGLAAILGAGAMWILRRRRGRSAGCGC